MATMIVNPFLFTPTVPTVNWDDLNGTAVNIVTVNNTAQIVSMSGNLTFTSQFTPAPQGVGWLNMYVNTVLVGSVFDWSDGSFNDSGFSYGVTAGDSVYFQARNSYSPGESVNLGDVTVYFNGVAIDAINVLITTT